MAKDASLFLAKTKGRVGEVVFYRAGGTQRARQYISKVNDKKSLRQYRQRTSLANLTISYAALKRVIINSFQKRPISQSAYNAFVSLNKSHRLVYMSKSEVESRSCFVHDLFISNGALLPIGTNIKLSDAGVASVLLTSAPVSVMTFAQFKQDYFAKFHDARNDDKIIMIAIEYNSDFTLKDVNVISVPLDSAGFPDSVTYTADGLTLSGTEVSNTVGYAVAFMRYNETSTGAMSSSLDVIHGSTKCIEACALKTTAGAALTAAESYGYVPNSL